MTNVNSVFKSFLVENADYDGFFELPKLKTTDALPQKVIPFSKAICRSFTDFDCFVHFYEDDIRFERIWKNPKQYLNKLQKFKGIISPDFSLYRNMPLCMQMWNTYRGRALANWLYKNGVEIIPNVRFGDKRTYLFCFEGIEKNKTVSVGTHGCIQHKEDREYFQKGLAELVKRLSPQTIIVYGQVPDDIFKKYKDSNINILQFESEILKSRRQVTV